MLVRDANILNVTARRTFDAAEVNAVLNHPSVLPLITLPGLASLEVSQAIQNPRNVALAWTNGVILFLQHEPGIYEVHTNFIREKEHKGRGQYIKDCAEEAARWMFTRTDCMILLTRVPAFNKPAKLMMKVLGWSFEFERKSVWPTADGNVDMSFYSLHYHDWFRKAPDLAEIGKWFHDKLDSEFERHKVTRSSHPDDECHDRAAGSAIEMIVGGQTEKGIALYNRWAQFAGYLPISLVSRNPLLIDIGDALLQIENGDFKAVLCRTQPQ